MVKAAIIGGGFYGSCIALYLQKIGMEVTLYEKENNLLQRASLHNQARVHSGFHYPRNSLTAYRSLVNFPKFKKDFGVACIDKYKMLYCVAKNRSKVSPEHFYNLFKQMGAEISLASAEDHALFNKDLISHVFAVDELVFDAVILKSLLEILLAEEGVRIKCGKAIHCIKSVDDKFVLIDENQVESVKVNYVFNCTYSQLNVVRRNSGMHILPIKNELTEMALVAVPSPLQGLGITVMDGPFFSLMPFPSRNLHTLSHVRYTPHFQWDNVEQTIAVDKIVANKDVKSNYTYMIKDALRFMPMLRYVSYEYSLFEVKATLLQNEIDDGRPILFYEEPSMPGNFTVLGGKIDNIYDLLALLGGVQDRFNLNKISLNDLFKHVSYASNYI